MFLHQRFDYNVHMIQEFSDIDFVEQSWLEDHPPYYAFDTETDGLHVLEASPFLFVFGWYKKVFVLDLIEDEIFSSIALSAIYDTFKNDKYLFAHNTEFDINMMENYGMGVPEDIKVADSQTVFRLTEYSDGNPAEQRKGLEYVGRRHVHDDAKFAGENIKKIISKMNAQRKRDVKVLYDKIAKKDSSQEQLDNEKGSPVDKKITFKNHIPFGEAFRLATKDYIKYVESKDHLKYKEQVDFIRSLYKEANYLDVYKENPALMINYAVDDIVIVLEYLYRSIPVLKQTDPGLKIFKKECALIRETANKQRRGLRVDLDYLKDSYYSLTEYQENLYSELHMLIGAELTVNQRQELGRVFEQKFFTKLPKTDKGQAKLDNKVLVNIIQETPNLSLKRVSLLIKKLRTVDKWISTYIVGILNQVYEGRFHPKIDASGTVSGRYSGNMQQMPRDALLDNVEDSKDDKRNAKELFHPRRMILADKDYYLVFMDYSQQELRIQAEFTILLNRPDLHLCRAYIPFECVSKLTGERFNSLKEEHLKRINSQEWVLEEDTSKIWTPTDMHSLTTANAYPNEFVNDKSHPDYDFYRSKGKSTNFLEIYLGGVNALQETLEIPIEEANDLHYSFQNTYKGVISYQQKTIDDANLYGYQENIYGRRYYLSSSRNAYKLANYKIQGSGADMIKKAELLLAELFKDTKSYVVMSIHDEIAMSIHKDELYLVPKALEVMIEAGAEVKHIPMQSDIEITDKSWADVIGWSEFNVGSQNYS